MALQNDDVDRIAERVIGCAIEVHRTQGPGLLEGVYRDCLLIELAETHLPFECERPTVIEYKGRRIRTPLKVDILVSGQVVVEVKAVERLHPVHQAQVITYLKLTGCPAGLLLNFNAATLKAGLKRLDHPERYTKPLTNQGDHRRTDPM